MNATLALASLLLAPSAASPSEDLAQLKVAFVGNGGTERSESFVEFLGQHVATVAFVERTESDPQALRKADVVVLDWSQQEDGVMSWISDREAKRHTPLGDRAGWDVPTVLIGSAGLNLAAAWDLAGTFG